MIERFKVEGVAYVVSYDEVRSIFTFYIDVLNSDYNVAPLSREARMWGDVSPDTVWTKTDVKDVFKIKHHIVEFIDHALRRFEPHYFRFSANEAIKVPVYRRIAAKLAKKYGYALYEHEGYVFDFYREN